MPGLHRYNTQTVATLAMMAEPDLRALEVPPGKRVPELSWTGLKNAQWVNFWISRSVKKGTPVEAPEAAAPHVAAHLLWKYGEALEQNPSLDTMVRFWPAGKDGIRGSLCSGIPGLEEAFQKDLVKAAVREGQFEYIHLSGDVLATWATTEEIRTNGENNEAQARFYEVGYDALHDLTGYDFDKWDASLRTEKSFAALATVAQGVEQNSVTKIREGLGKLDKANESHRAFAEHVLKRMRRTNATVGDPTKETSAIREAQNWRLVVVTD